MKKLNKVMALTLTASIVLNPIMVSALEKKETVYANLNYDGSSYKTTVNNHLYVDSKDGIEDFTELTDILNLNGEEKFKLDNNKILWESTGKDIFYQGVTKKELPISVSAKYYLNDEEKNVKDIIGKKGNVKIELGFTNNSYTYKNSKRLYTPFVTTVATMINATDNDNIEISSGKVIDTGTKNIVVGIASPGLYESTNLDELKDLDKITITYDTTKFSLSDIYIVSTPKLLEDTDLDVFNKMDNLTSSVSKLQDGMNKLEDGTNKLKDGSNKLNEGANTLNNEVNKASKTLKNKVNSTFSESNLDAIGQEASEKATGVIDDAGNTIATIASSTALSSVNQEINNTDINAIGENAKAMAQSQFLTQLGLPSYAAIDYITLTSDEVNSINTQVATLSSAMSSYGTNELDAVQQQVLSNGLQQSMKQTKINTVKQIYNAVGDTAKTVAMQAANTSSDKIREVASQVAESTANSVASKIAYETAKTTLGSAKDSLLQISGSMNTLSDATNRLKEGTNQLNDGINELSNGANEFNTQGIKKLNEYANKFKGYSSKTKELVNLSKEYKGYTTNNADSTIFIYKMKSAK